VRERVSFLAQPDVAPLANPGQAEPAPVPATEPTRQPAAETTTETQPRRAGWWSRRFGGGQ
jgi:ribonuclease E